MAVTQMHTPLSMPAMTGNGSSFGRALLGLVAGWRAFRTYEALAALDGRALAERGLTRHDLPQRALAAIRLAL